MWSISIFAGARDVQHTNKGKVSYQEQLGLGNGQCIMGDEGSYGKMGLDEE